MNNELVGLKALVNDVNKNVVEGNVESESRETEILNTLASMMKILSPDDNSGNSFFTGETTTGTYVSFENYIQKESYVHDPSTGGTSRTVYDNFMSTDDIESGVLIGLPCGKNPKMVVFRPSDRLDGNFSGCDIPSDQLAMTLNDVLTEAAEKTHQENKIYRTPKWLLGAVVFVGNTIPLLNIFPAHGPSHVYPGGIMTTVGDNKNFDMDINGEDAYLDDRYYPQLGVVSICDGAFLAEYATEDTLYLRVPALFKGIYDYTIYY